MPDPERFEADPISGHMGSGSAVTSMAGFDGAPCPVRPDDRQEYRRFSAILRPFPA